MGNRFDAFVWPRFPVALRTVTALSFAADKSTRAYSYFDFEK
jgi:hypothetical protein